jgi:Tol biopolymer transport system component
MKFRIELGMTAVCLFIALAMPVWTVAQEPTHGGTSGTEDRALNNNLATNDHDHGPRNGDLAVSATTVVDGTYGTAQIATLPNDGGPYHFLTFVNTVPNGAYFPDFTPDGRTIFFETFGDQTRGDFIIFVPAKGGALTPLQTDCASNDPNCGDANPAISPDGRELLTVREVGPLDNNGCLVFVGIMRFHIDGSHPKQLTPVGPPCSGDDQPRWSPDGKWIVFQHGDASGVVTLWTMDRDGSHKQQLTAMTDVARPDWSPDGERIVFQSPAQPADDQHPQQIYTIHPDGTQLLQITHYVVIPGVTIATNASRWSPDGQKLVFAHRDPNTTIGPDGQPHGDVFEMNPDGSDVVQINFTPEKDNDTTWGARH